MKLTKELLDMPMLQDPKENDVENTLMCARWLIGEFEKLDMHSIAQLFQRALDDSVSWLNTMPVQNNRIDESREGIKIREVQLIRDILVKYASIQNPERREKALHEMRLATKSSDDSS